MPTVEKAQGDCVRYSSSNVFTMSKKVSDTTANFQYSLDKITWNELTTTPITAQRYSDGYAVYIKNSSTNYKVSNTSYCLIDIPSGNNISISGDSRNLLFSDSWSTATTTSGVYKWLLANTRIVNASDFRITIYNATGCCQALAENNSNLIYGPEFNFVTTTISKTSIFAGAFLNCTNLVNRYKFTGITFSGNNAFQSFYYDGATLYSSSGTGHTKAYKTPNYTYSARMSYFSKLDTGTSATTISPNTTYYIDDNCILDS